VRLEDDGAAVQCREAHEGPFVRAGAFLPVPNTPRPPPSAPRGASPSLHANLVLLAGRNRRAFWNELRKSARILASAMLIRRRMNRL